MECTSNMSALSLKEDRSDKRFFSSEISDSFRDMLTQFPEEATAITSYAGRIIALIQDVDAVNDSLCEQIDLVSTEGLSEALTEEISKRRLAIANKLEKDELDCDGFEIGSHVFWDLQLKAEELIEQGKYDECMELLEPLIPLTDYKNYFHPRWDMIHLVSTAFAAKTNKYYKDTEDIDTERAKQLNTEAVNLEKEDRDQAINLLKEALSIEPEACVLVGNLANMLANENRMEELYILLKKMETYYPSNSTAYIEIRSYLALWFFEGL